MKIAHAFALALLMTACQQEQSENSVDRTTSEDMAEDNRISAPAGAAASTAIPESLHGRWGLAAGDCTSTRGDAKGLLTISAEELRFYESRGVLGEIMEQTPTRIVADFAFTGEGMEWTRRMTLDVEQDGNVLIRREEGEGAAPGAFRYMRCGLTRPS
jgi:hypothetical protein